MTRRSTGLDNYSEASNSSTSCTRSRMPRIVGAPWQMAGSAVIRSRRLTSGLMTRSYVGETGLATNLPLSWVSVLMGV